MTSNSDLPPMWEQPYVVGQGARRLRRLDVARSPALAVYSKFVGLLTLKQPEVRAPTSGRLADPLRSCQMTDSRSPISKFAVNLHG
jgi:hypothetical protein